MSVTGAVVVDRVATAVVGQGKVFIDMAIAELIVLIDRDIPTHAVEAGETRHAREAVVVSDVEVVIEGDEGGERVEIGEGSIPVDREVIGRRDVIQSSETLSLIHI